MTGALWCYYRARLRTQAPQELLALAGIAAGVALMLALLAANASAAEQVIGDDSPWSVASDEQSKALVTGVALLIGGVLAFTATRLTVPERRCFVAELRLQGFGSGHVLAQVLFELLLLWLAGSALGLALGDQLSRQVGGSSSLDEQRLGMIAGATLMALAAVLVAGAWPLLDALARVPGRLWPTASKRALLFAGLALLGTVTAAVALAPQLEPSASPSPALAPRLGASASAALALALVLVLPAVFCLALRGLVAASRRPRLGLLSVPASELAATPTRALALAGIAALTLFGVVAIDGAQRDALRSVDHATGNLTRAADLWVTSSVSSPVRIRQRARQLARTPGIAAVHAYDVPPWVAPDRLGATREPTVAALALDVDARVSPADGREIATAALDGGTLAVQTAAERAASLRTSVRARNARIDEIATLALIGAIVALAVATAAGVWVRRAALAELRLQGFSRLQLWSALLAETAVLVGCGGLIGTLFGLYGQALTARWLDLDPGIAPAFLPALTTLATVTVAALALAALPGYAAAHVPLRLSFRGD